MLTIGHSIAQTIAETQGDWPRSPCGERREREGGREDVREKREFKEKEGQREGEREERGRHCKKRP